MWVILFSYGSLVTKTKYNPHIIINAINEYKDLEDKETGVDIIAEFFEYKNEKNKTLIRHVVKEVLFTMRIGRVVLNAEKTISAHHYVCSHIKCTCYVKYHIAIVRDHIGMTNPCLLK